MNRRQAITKFYRQVGKEVVDLPFAHPRPGSFLPGIGAVFALPSVKPLLEDDTETVTEDQWIEAAPEARLIVMKWWRDYLKQLLDGAEKGGAASSDETNKNSQDGASCETETEEAIASSTVALRARLSAITSLYQCKATWCTRKIWWFPDLINHGASSHFCDSAGELSNQFRLPQLETRELIKRLLKDLGVDHETVKPSDTIINVQTQRNFLCTRCDEKLAKYMNFTELVRRFLDGISRFQLASYQSSSLTMSSDRTLPRSPKVVR